ncbi:aspartate kinase [Gloeocapsa sp. PCC 73106]|uniref:aspartate kinase n=1 Tax=Gloeocapsa sp. PCC 73106 TaxID=102232 RepID=UPI0002ABEEE8|nr:aspartate kinase [Gloeocapsa sp. PCC 73106]ELR96267.1 aspartate kinase [Gloeocapsa sp. PCC 73106]
MALIVQKYGGTSVGSIERIKKVAERVQKTVNQGNQVVVVVSAMGKTTDGLVNLAKELSDNPCRREMDMLLSTGEQVSIALLSIALQALGQDAVSLTGAQVGIVTEAEHSRARILEIKIERMQRHLAEGKVVVVAGFQGISQSEELEITTLGRGGSDTSAVALAAALKADLCEIYTDVPGILTTDPRIVPEAQLIREITCDEMLELASLGAKVLHPRAVEIARNYGVSMVVRSSWSEDPGTKVISPSPQFQSLEGLELTRSVDAVEFDANQVQIALLQVPDRPGIAARLFSAIAEQCLDVDLIIQSLHEGNSNDIAFTVTREMSNKAEAIAEAIAPALRSDPQRREEAEVVVAKEIAKVTITGAGMIGRSGVAAKMCQTLADAGINIKLISTSEVKISCVIAAAELNRAIAALCNAFEVHSSPVRSWTSEAQKVPAVRGVALDLKQARLAIRHVPDRPGMAAAIFNLLAQHKISVYTIIQSQHSRYKEAKHTRDVVFTIAEEEVETACTALANLLEELDCPPILVDKEIAKISIVGAGMIGQAGVAAKFFAALAQEKINIEMIATSEIKISCVVPKQDAEKALQVAHTAFNLAGQSTITVPT